MHKIFIEITHSEPEVDTHTARFLIYLQFILPK
jgi:hypothetical protein